MVAVVQNIIENDLGAQRKQLIPRLQKKNRDNVVFLFRNGRRRLKLEVASRHSGFSGKIS